MATTVGLENGEIVLYFKRRKRHHYGGDYESTLFNEAYVSTCVDIWEIPPFLSRVYIECESPLRKQFIE